MKKTIKIYSIFIILFMFISSSVLGQGRLENLRNNLEAMSIDVPGLNNTIQDLSVSEVSIQNFVRAIAASNELNITVSPGIEQTIVSNFSNVDVIDVLIYLCKEHSLTLDFVGTIIIVKEYTAPKIIDAKQTKEILIEYNKNTELISLDLKNDSLINVAKAITDATNKNVLYSPKAKNTIVTAYIKNKFFDDALNKLAYANNLTCTYTPDGFYIFETVDKTTKQNNGDNSSTQEEIYENLNYTIDIDGERFSITANDVPIAELLGRISSKLQKNYFLLNELAGNTSLSLSNITYEEFLNCILSGSKSTYSLINNLYMIGELSNPSLYVNEIITLQHRPVENIIGIIPDYLSKNILVTEYSEMNSLIVSGTPNNILQLKSFIRSIDLLVPVVLIEVIIIDQTKDFSISSGVNAGLSTTPVETQGTLYPYLNMTLSSGSINKLIQGFNGFGLINLGKVVPDFYMTIQAMESQGFLTVRSTPKLSTISGQSSSMVIGETEYYIEEKNNVISNQSTQNIVTRTYKSVQANFSLEITPVVTGDDQIFLEITVDQSDFTSKIDPNAPPGQVSRNFSSTIRVKNGEMILLGGLEEKSKDDSGTGLPLLSRIPVVRWLFSTRSKKTSKNKLGIFIKPTIIR
jgi:type IV pilus assembly protein PilQ